MAQCARPVVTDTVCVNMCSLALLTSLSVGLINVQLSLGSVTAMLRDAESAFVSSKLTKTKC